MSSMRSRSAGQSLQQLHLHNMRGGEDAARNFATSAASPPASPRPFAMARRLVLLGVIHAACAPGPAAAPAAEDVPRPGKMIKTCQECVRAGLGWSLKKSACSMGFANRRCPTCWHSAHGIELEVSSPPGLSMSTFSSSGRPMITQFRPSGDRQAAECGLLKPGQALQSVDGRIVVGGRPAGAVDGLGPAEAVATIHGPKWPLRLTFGTMSEELEPKPAPASQPLPRPTSAAGTAHSLVEQTRKVIHDAERKRAEHITALLPQTSLGIADDEADEWELRRRNLLGQLHAPEQPASRPPPPSPRKVPPRRHFSEERPAETRSAGMKKAKLKAAQQKEQQKQQAEEYRVAMTALTTMLHECDPVYLGAQIGWTAEVFRKTLSPTRAGVSCEVDTVAVDAICGDERDFCLKILEDLADHPEPGMGWNAPGELLLASLNEAAAAAEEQEASIQSDGQRTVGPLEPHPEPEPELDGSCADGSSRSEGETTGGHNGEVAAAAGTTIWSLFFG
jgi:hypothetical protein